MANVADRRLMGAVGAWIEAINDYPGWKEWNKAKISNTLWHDDPDCGADLRPSAFRFSGETGKQHAAIMSYLTLSAGHQSLLDCQYYFRRYPFHGLPVSRETHLRYVCEMYFSRIFEFRERLDKCLEAVGKSVLGGIPDSGRLLNSFKSQFKQEIAARNTIQHETHFDNVAIDNLYLLAVMSQEDEIDIWWKKRSRRGYRNAAAEWAARVRERSRLVEGYLGAVASLMLENCLYLSDPGKAAASDVEAPPD